MIQIPSVTLICIDCYNYGPAVEAIRKTLKQIKPYKAIFLTDIQLELEDIEIVQIPTINSKEEYSHFVLKNLKDYFYTSHCLLIQHDGYVLDGKAWNPDFLKYDYIGAPWLYPDNNVGNGGFSLRSHRLQMLLGGDSFIKSTHPEDENIGRLYRNYLEKEYSISFAPVELAEKFSFELNKPTCSTFGFHGKFHEPYKPVVVIKRTGAMGDVIMAEPLLKYFFDNGYEVYLDTQPQIMAIFFNNTYPINHVSYLNEKCKPEKVINLDMSYESQPKKNVLETYFKFSGVELTDEYRRNSKLNVYKNAKKWIFEKYVVFHIDDTGMPHRNVHAVDWQKIQNYLEALGYTVIQVGQKNRNKIGLYFHTAEIPLLMYLLAGADCVIGIDSGIAQLSVALNIKTVIITGSVNLKLRYQNFDNIEVIKTPCFEEKNEYCYHNTDNSVVGTSCVYSAELPPCTIVSSDQIISSFNKLNYGNSQNS